MAAIPATGTRGQFPGVGAGGQPRRRNPVNVPRTWRGTRIQASNVSIIALAGVGSTDTNATATLTVLVPLAGAGGTNTNATSTLLVAPSALLLPRTLIPGISHGRPRSRNPVNAPRTFRGTRIPVDTTTVDAFVGVGRTDSNATGVLTVIYPPALLPSNTTLIPGVAHGVRNHRNPVNAPRTFRGTRVQTTPPPVTGVALAGAGSTDTNATAILFVAALSLQGSGSTDSAAVATLGLSGLTGAGQTGSVATGTLSEALPLAGEGISGAVGIATLTVGITESFTGFGSTSTQATGTLSAAIPLAGSATTDTAGIASLSIFGQIALAGAATTSTVGVGSLKTSVALAGSALTDSLASSTLSLAIPLSGIATELGLGTAFLQVADALGGFATTGSIARGTLLSPVAFSGVAITSTLGIGSLLVPVAVRQEVDIALMDGIAFVLIQLKDI